MLSRNDNTVLHIVENSHHPTLLFLCFYCNQYRFILTAKRSRVGGSGIFSPGFAPDVTRDFRILAAPPMARSALIAPPTAHSALPSMIWPLPESTNGAHLPRSSPSSDHRRTLALRSSNLVHNYGAVLTSELVALSSLSLSSLLILYATSMRIAYDIETD
jgi:hypothetical protein